VFLDINQIQFNFLKNLYFYTFDFLLPARHVIMPIAMKKHNRKTAEKIATKAPAREERTLAALAYLFILCFVPLLKSERSEFVKEHARQGFVIFLLEIFNAVILFFPLKQFLAIFLIAFSAWGFIKALSGDQWKAPWLYSLSEKIKI